MNVAGRYLLESDVQSRAQKAGSVWAIEPHRGISRRQWLLDLLRIGCIGWFAKKTRGFAESSQRLHLAFVSDTHISADPEETYRGFSPAKNLKTAVAQIVEANPQLVVFCGDLARLCGLEQDYVQLRQLLEPLARQIPLVFALGNHDDRDAFLKLFGGLVQPSPVLGKHVQKYEVSTFRILVLDSLDRVNSTPGRLGAQQLEWLDGELKNNPNRPTFVVLHHTLGNRAGDLQDTESLLAIAKQHGHLRALVFGHSHVWDVRRWEHLYWINIPSLGYSFSDTQPVGWVEAWIEDGSCELLVRQADPARGGFQGSLRLEWPAFALPR